MHLMDWRTAGGSSGTGMGQPSSADRSLQRPQGHSKVQQSTEGAAYSNALGMLNPGSAAWLNILPMLPANMGHQTGQVFIVPQAAHGALPQNFGSSQQELLMHGSAVDLPHQRLLATAGNFFPGAGQTLVMASSSTPLMWSSDMLPPSGATSGQHASDALDASMTNDNPGSREVLHFTRTYPSNAAHSAVLEFPVIRAQPKAEAAASIHQNNQQEGRSQYSTDSKSGGSAEHKRARRRGSGSSGAATSAGTAGASPSATRLAGRASDEVKGSKEKNRQAQRRFRERQKVMITSLKKDVDKLQGKLSDANACIQALERENIKLKAKLDANRDYQDSIMGPWHRMHAASGSGVPLSGRGPKHDEHGALGGVCE